MACKTNIEIVPALSLAAILDALSDDIRRQIVYRLFMEPRRCTSFGDLGSKTRLSYHYAQLRKAGITSTQKQGANLLISLRLNEVEGAFPGLLKAVLKGTAELDAVPKKPTKLKMPARRQKVKGKRLVKSASR